MVFELSCISSSEASRWPHFHVLLIHAIFELCRMDYFPFSLFQWAYRSLRIDGIRFNLLKMEFHSWWFVILFWPFVSGHIFRCLLHLLSIHLSLFCDWTLQVFCRQRQTSFYLPSLNGFYQLITSLMNPLYTFILSQIGSGWKVRCMNFCSLLQVLYYDYD